MFGGVTELAPVDRRYRDEDEKLKAEDGEVEYFDIDELEWSTVSMQPSTLRPHGIAEKSCVWNDYVSSYFGHAK